MFCFSHQNEKLSFGSNQSKLFWLSPQIENSMIYLASLATFSPSFSRPGTLKRALVSQCLDDCLSKRSRTSSVGSMNNTYAGGIPSSIRNAIASSYSSTRGLSKVGHSVSNKTPGIHRRHGGLGWHGPMRIRQHCHVPGNKRE